MEVTLCPAQDAQDWAYIRRICCETGNGGEPIDPQRWAFFAELWIGPYEKLEPHSTWIARVDGERAGYLTGCIQTKRFCLRKRLFFEFKLALLILLGRYTWNSDTRRFLRRLVHLERAPEECFPLAVRSQIAQEFPAHLHINVESRFRNAQVGSQLMDAFKNQLVSLRASGVHVFCGEKPLPFYARQGFHEIARIEYRPSVWVYALGFQSQRSAPHSP